MVSKLIQFFVFVGICLVVEAASDAEVIKEINAAFDNITAYVDKVLTDQKQE